MPLQPESFNDMYTTYENTVANNSPITNFRSGSVARALGLALTGNGIALQKLIAQFAKMTRLGTSELADAITFVQDFGMQPLPAVGSTGVLVVERSSVGSVQGEAVGAIAQTPSGTQFQVIQDTNQSAWNPLTGQYEFGTTDTQINVTVQCTQVGTVGNVAAMSITQMVSGFIGVSAVYNPLGFTNGADAETLPALRTRFVNYLASLAKSSNAAIGAAILGVQPNVSYQIIEYKHFDGSAFVSGFTVVADDGTGSANTAFLSAVNAAVDAVRAAGVQFEVHAPTNIPISLSCTITPQPGVALPIAQANATIAFQNYIKRLGTGVSAPFASIDNALATASGVFAVTGLTVNGGSADVTITATEIAQPGTVTYV